jgi:hypothetical protein
MGRVKKCTKTDQNTKGIIKMAENRVMEGLSGQTAAGMKGNSPIIC